MIDRRRSPRVPPPPTLKARVRAYLSARVIDISTSGVLLELPHSLPPRTGCDLKIRNGDEEIILPASVRRCAVAGFGTDEKGQKALVYRAALEFTEPLAQTQAKMAAVLPELKASPDSRQVTLGVDGGDITFE